VDPSKAAHAIFYSATLIVALFVLTGGAMTLVGGLNYNLKGRPLSGVLHAINPKAY
jgi:type III secretory pathway component EscT